MLDADADDHGHAEGGRQLTAVPGTWDAGATLTYQWTVDGTDVAGATGTTYTRRGRRRQDVTVKVTGTKTGYTTGHQESAARPAPVANGDQVLTPKPTITGTPKVGEAADRAPGTWDDGVALTYQWTVDGTPLRPPRPTPTPRSPVTSARSSRSR